MVEGESPLKHRESIGKKRWDINLKIWSWLTKISRGKVFDSFDIIIANHFFTLDQADGPPQGEKFQQSQPTLEVQTRRQAKSDFVLSQKLWNIL